MLYYNAIIFFFQLQTIILIKIYSQFLFNLSNPNLYMDIFIYLYNGKYSMILPIEIRIKQIFYRTTNFFGGITIITIL